MRVVAVSWAFLKNLYWAVAYYLVSLTPEEYHIRKANNWVAVQRYREAIRNYRKALKYREDSRVRAAAGWCYAQLGMTEAALRNYRRAYKRNKHPRFALELAFAEYWVGNISEARKLVGIARDSYQEMDPEDRADLQRLEEAMGKSPPDRASAAGPGGHPGPSRSSSAARGDAPRPFPRR